MGQPNWILRLVMGQKNIVVFSSHVARGTVGLRAAALALEALGNGVWSIPTTVLSHHPGHGTPSGFTPSDDEFGNLVESLSSSKWVNEIDAILFGYFASAGQVEIAAEFSRRICVQVKEKRLLKVVDPVMGDNGRLYINEETATAIRTHLLPIADVITPNRFELQWLSESAPLTSNNDILRALRPLLKDGACQALVTSAFPLMKNGTGSLYVNARKAMLAEHRHFNDPPNGLGDLTAALFTHHLLQDAPPETALQKTTGSVAEVLSATLAANKDELALEANLSSLSRTTHMVQLRQLLIPAK